VTPGGESPGDSCAWSRAPAEAAGAPLFFVQCIEHGRVVEGPQAPESRRGLQVLTSLQQRARAAMSPKTTFAELCALVIAVIDSAGCEDLDLRGQPLPGK
jgi:hypothetical protein